MLRFLAAAWIAAIVCALPAIASASSPPTWSEPVQIGPEIPSSWFPEIDADATGATRIVWSGTLVEGDANLSDELNGAVMFSQLTENGWSEPADIAVMDGGIASRPIIASDGQYAHMIYRTADPGAPVPMVYSRAPLTSDLNDANSWSRPFILSSDESYWGQIVVLPGGSLLVVYNREATAQINGNPERRSAIFARRSTDQGATWSDEARVAETVERVARVSLSAVPDSDHVVVAWDEGYDNLTAQGTAAAVATCVSDDGGVTWSPCSRFAGQFEQSQVATNGPTTVMTYRSIVDPSILYRASSDGGVTWSDEQPIPDAVARRYSGPHNFDKMTAAFDGDGRLLFTWIGANPDAPNGLSVMLATYAAGAWTEPQAIASPVGFPEYPHIAVALGNQVEIVYFVRDKEFDIGKYTLWSISGTSDASPTAPREFDPVYQAVAVPPTPAPVTIEQAPAVPAEPTAVGAIPAGNVSPQSTLTAPLLPVIAVTFGVLVVAAALRLLLGMGRGART